MTIIFDIGLLLGLCCIVVGCYMIWQPLAFIVGGIVLSGLCLVIANKGK